MSVPRFWLKQYRDELASLLAVAFSPRLSLSRLSLHPLLYSTCIGLAISTISVILLWIGFHPTVYELPVLSPKISLVPSPLPRRPPPRFPPGTHLPRIPETRASGPLDLPTFCPEYDLVRFDDPRVWWESDHDSSDNEDDHLMHRNLVPPLKRLIELVEKYGGHLEVQDAYRPSGVHSPRSLHKEGRAVDLTCRGLSLEDLARFAYAAGFDWVYYESGGRGGDHVHCSVRR
ncbi:MAG TPA: hypothetical protein EYP62_07720 [Kiritimatiellae bacterium]|nr:hypothetical protein [Kiritimatiellia bacterium]